MTARPPPIEIDVGHKLQTTAFSANGEYLVSGGDGARVWRVEDVRLKQLATMKAGGVQCLAVSNDGKLIAAGTTSGKAIVWDTKTYEPVWTFKKGMQGNINGVDFSPDSTRLVSASNKTAIVWDMAVGKQVQTLRHEGRVTGAKYSPQGDRIATATSRSFQVWDSNDGRLLLNRNVAVIPEYNTGLLWFGNNHLLVVLDSAIRQFETSSGSAVSEWPVSDTGSSSCIALPKNGEFIAYSTRRSLTFWDTSTHTRLGLIQHPQDIRSVALSPDDRFIATGREGRKITIRSLFPFANSIPLSRLHTTFQEPDFRIDDPPLDAWKQDHLANADALLTSAIHESRDLNPPVLASRALVRARLQHWDAALEDAEKATQLQPSVIGYIAKSIAHVGKGERHKAYEACDIAFELFHSSHGTFILLIKAIIMFMAGEQRDAISRVDDLIATVHLNSICYVVQAYMYLLLGNSQMEASDYKGSIQSFEYARARMQHHTSQPLFVVSMVSGWKFDNLDITIRQRLCEALCAAGDFSLEHPGDTAVDAQQYHEAISHYTTALSLNPLSQQGVLIKRSKAFLAAGSWKQALDDANKAITLDPSSPWGYEMKHAALHKARDYDNAIDAFEEMLSKIAQSPAPDVQ
ncbi:WD40 repeat-like protein, partial [Imleria badia]